MEESDFRANKTNRCLSQHVSGEGRPEGPSALLLFRLSTPVLRSDRQEALRAFH